MYGCLGAGHSPSTVERDDGEKVRPKVWAPAASPGRLWQMITRSKLLLPHDQQVAALHAVRDQWAREGRDFGNRSIAPDRLLPVGDTGHLEAAASFGDASVIGSADQDHLDVIVSSVCYDAVKGRGFRQRLTNGSADA